MSRNPDDYTDTRRTAVALERIADTLDDYLEMSLTVTSMTSGLGPDVSAAMKPLSDVVERIRNRRADW